MAKDISSTACYVPLATDDDVVAVGVPMVKIEPRRFCCCNVRWATIIMNLITITFNSAAIIGFFVGVKVLENNADKVDDDAVEKLLENGGIYWIAGFFEVVCFIGIILHSFGVYGALKHKTWALKVAAVAYAIPFAFSVLGFNLLNALFYGLFLYPHIVLLNEIKTGVMADSNLENVRPISCIQDTDEEKPLLSKKESLTSATTEPDAATTSTASKSKDQVVAIDQTSMVKQDPIDPLIAGVYPDEVPELEMDPADYQAKQDEIEQRIDALKTLIVNMLPDLAGTDFEAACQTQGQAIEDLEVAEDNGDNAAINAATAIINETWGTKITLSTDIVDEVDFDKLEPLVLECCILIQSTPQRLAQFRAISEEHDNLWTDFVSDVALMKSFVYNGQAYSGRYYKALQIHAQLIEAMGFPSPERRKIALAISLELAKPILMFRREEQIDPIDRFWHYVNAFDQGELYPGFSNFAVWEMRHIVNSDASNEELQWGRDHLKRLRPDQVRVEAPHLKYMWSYNTTIPRPQMHFAENYKELLSGGGACGPQSWWCRFICRSFGWPVWGCIQPGHAALSKWVKDVECWDTYAGFGFNASRWRESRYYDNNREVNQEWHGVDFNEDTRARYNGKEDEEYYKISTFYECIGEIMGERLDYPKVLNTKIWRQVGLSQRRMLALRQWNNPPAEVPHWPSDSQLLPGVSPKFVTDETVVETTPGKEFTIPSAIFSHPPPNDMQVQRQDFDLAGWGPNYRSRNGDKSIIVMNSYEPGTGNQIWHAIKKDWPSLDFEYDIPDMVPAGAYAVTAKICTVHQDQIPLHVCGLDTDGIETSERKSIEIINSVGEWHITEPAIVDLIPGGRLKFTREFPEDEELKDARYRLVIKEFYLVAQ